MQTLGDLIAHNDQRKVPIVVRTHTFEFRIRVVLFTKANGISTKGKHLSYLLIDVLKVKNKLGERGRK